MDRPEEPQPEEGGTGPSAGSRRVFLFLLLLLLGGLATWLGWLAWRSVPRTGPEQLAHARKLEQELAAELPRLAAAEAQARRAEVIEAYERVLDRFGDRASAPEAWRSIGRLHEEAKAADRAIERYRKLAETFPADPGAPADLERAARLAAEERKDPAAARKLHLRLAELFPSDRRAPASRLAAARLLDEKIPGRAWAEVEKDYLEVARLFPTSPEAAEALWSAARILEEQGQPARAVELYLRLEKEHKGSPLAPQAMRRRGELLADRLGKPQEAAEVFRQLVERYPDSREAAYAKSRTGDLGKQAAEGKAREYLSGHYGGGGEGGLIYDQTARWTEEKQRLFRDIAAQSLDVLEVSLDARIQPATKRADLEARITLTHRAARPARELLFFLGEEAVVEKAELEGRAATHDHKEGRLTVFLDAPFPAGERRTLALRWKIDQSARALEQAHQVKIAESGFAMADAGWFPVTVFGDLFTFRARYKLPAGYELVSPGEPGRTAAGAGGETEHEWSSSLPVFGLYWAYGKWQQTRAAAGAVDLRLFTFAPWRRANEALDLARQVLEFYAERFGPYPYNKLWIVEVDLPPPFAGVGPASLLWLSRAQFKQDELPVSVMAHEIAHQWWGNLVPVALFSHPGYAQWLSEGFACYSEALFIERRYDRAKMQAHLERYRELFLDLTRQFHEKPLTEPLGAGPGYFAVVYMKGCWVLHMLRWLMGDRAFLAALARYAERFRWKPSSIEDFRKICEETSGLSLERFFADWVGGLGCVRYDLAGGTRRPAAGKPSGWEASFELQQRATKVKAGEAPPPSARPPFSTPVEVEIQGERPEERVTVRLEVTAAPQRFTLPVPWKPARVRLDPGERLLKVPGPHNQHDLR